MKKLRKSVNICQSYQKNKSGTFFMAHGVETFYMMAHRTFKKNFFLTPYLTHASATASMSNNPFQELGQIPADAGYLVRDE